MNPAAQHDVRVRQDLRWAGQTAANWVAAHPHIDHDVMVIGAGQSGVAIGTALQSEGIGRITIVEAETEDRAGSWKAKARMECLRTAKSGTGPELGVPSMTFQAWYEARFGSAAYTSLERIRTGDWIAYLDWLRSLTDAPVRYGTQVLGIAREQDRFRVHLRTQAGEVFETCRKVVLATGIAGCGAPYVPQAISQHLPRHLYAHTDESMDFTALAGKTVVVAGAASAAFDAAATALEAGAAAVHLLCRQPRLAESSNMAALNYRGAQENFHHLPDAVRWQLAWHFRERSPGPTAAVVARAVRFANFHLHLDAADPVFLPTPDGLRVQLGEDMVEAHYLIAGTGYRCDLSRRAELSAIAPSVALWRDCYAIAPDESDRPNAFFPYLGEGYEFKGLNAETTSWLKDIHCFNFAAVTSFGRHVGDVGSIRFGVPRLVRQIAKDFMLDDLPAHVAKLTAAVPGEIHFDSYSHAVYKPAATARKPGPPT